MSLSIHRRTGHGRALLSVVCAERNESEFRANREKQETTTSFCALNGAALCTIGFPVHPGQLCDL